MVCCREGGECQHGAADHSRCDDCRHSVNDWLADEIDSIRRANGNLLKKLEAATAALGIVPPAIRDAIARNDVETCIRYGQAVDANVELMREDLENARRRGKQVEALEAVIREVRNSNGLAMTRDPGQVKTTSWECGVPLGEWLRDQRLPFVKQRDEARRERDDALKERDAARFDAARMTQENERLRAEVERLKLERDEALAAVADLRGMLSRTQERAGSNHAVAMDALHGKLKAEVDLAAARRAALEEAAGILDRLCEETSKRIEANKERRYFEGMECDQSEVQAFANAAEAIRAAAKEES